MPRCQSPDHPPANYSLSVVYHVIPPNHFVYFNLLRNIAQNRPPPPGYTLLGVYYPEPERGPVLNILLDDFPEVFPELLRQTTQFF